MEEKLIKVWKTFSTKELALVFERYMKSIGVEKDDRRKKNQQKSYFIDGKSTNWNKVECYYFQKGKPYYNIALKIVLRKEAGNYFIMQNGGERVFEVDYSGIRNYKPDLLEVTINAHKPLFDALFAI